MSDDIQRSFVDALLDRSAGQTQGFKPAIKPYFLQETKSDAPLVEDTTLEQRVESEPTHEHAPVPRDRSAPRAQNADHPQSAHQRVSDPDTQGEQPPIEVSNAPDRALDQKLTRPQQDNIAPPARVSPVDHGTTHSTIENSVSPNPVSITEPLDTQTRHIHPDPEIPRDISTQLAAAVARLTSNTTPAPEERDDAPNAPLMPLTDASPWPVQKPVSQDAVEQVSEPVPELHIHIGEIIIEAENEASTPSEPALPPRAKWAPHMSLDAYRDARRRGQR